MELQTLLCRTKGYRQSKTKTAPTGSLRSRAMPTVQSKARRKCAERNEFDVSLSTSRCLFPTPLLLFDTNVSFVGKPRFLPRPESEAQDVVRGPALTYIVQVSF